MKRKTLAMLLLLAWMPLGCTSMRGKLSSEIASIDLPSRSGNTAIVHEADLASYPKSVQRYLGFMGVVGRPRDWSFRLSWVGRFRTKPEQGWMDMEAHQYNTHLARFFYMQLRMGGLPVMGRDTLFRGKGRMLIKPLDLFPVVDAQGPEYDIGELVTYLNDLIMFAPSMLLGPETRWSSVDQDSFDVSLTDHGTTVKARVFLDEKGAPKDFSTTDRFYADDPKHPVRAQWNTPASNWVIVEGRAVPTEGKAVWHLPQGEFTYADFRLDPKNIAFNLHPGE